MLITELQVKVQCNSLSLIRIDQEHAEKAVVKHRFQRPGCYWQPLHRPAKCFRIQTRPKCVELNTIFYRSSLIGVLFYLEKSEIISQVSTHAQFETVRPASHVFLVEVVVRGIKVERVIRLQALTINLKHLVVVLHLGQDLQPKVQRQHKLGIRTVHQRCFSQVLQQAGFIFPRNILEPSQQGAGGGLILLLDICLNDLVRFQHCEFHHVLLDHDSNVSKSPWRSGLILVYVNLLNRTLTRVA